MWRRAHDLRLCPRGGNDWFAADYDHDPGTRIRHRDASGGLRRPRRIGRINAELPLEEVAPNYDGETSTRWRYWDGTGEIGVISSVTRSFCHSSTRARVSTEGRLFTCLFATEGHDLRALLRGGCSDEQLLNVLGEVWRRRARS